MTNWDNKFIELSKHIASWGKDTSRKNSAIIVDTDNIVLSMGYNGFPIGCDDTKTERFERPAKYMFTEHAERNAIYHAAKLGISLKGSAMYVTLFPCADCARAIIQSGITKLIAIKPNLDDVTFGESFKAAIEMLDEANIEIKYIQ